MKKYVVMMGVLLCGAVAMAGEKVNLKAAGPSDLVSEHVVDASFRMKAPSAEKQAVSMNWAVEGPMNLAVAPHEGEGRGYYLKVNASDLYEGVTLPLTVPGALVRISPMGGEETEALDPARMVVVNGERAFSEGSGVDQLYTPEQMDAARGSFLTLGSSVFRIHESVGVGQTLLFVDDLAGVERDYLVHVFEQESPAVLSVRAANDTFVQGQTLAVYTQFSGARGSVAAQQMEGVVVSPNGSSFPLTFGRDGVGRLELNQPGDNTNGLWRVRVTATGLEQGLAVRRDAATAFALVVPTARFSGSATTSRTKDGVSASFDLEVGTAGRYEVRGVLFGSDASGALQPIAVSHSANWLNPGEHVLDLSFDQAHVTASGLSAPYMIRDLRLVHQDRMSLIHRQANGLDIR